MLKEYRKKTTIKAEQFDGSDEMVTKYDIDDWEKNEMPYHRDPRYFLPTKEGLMALGVGKTWKYGQLEDHKECIAFDKSEGSYILTDYDDFINYTRTGSIKISNCPFCGRKLGD